MNKLLFAIVLLSTGVFAAQVPCGPDLNEGIYSGAWKMRGRYWDYGGNQWVEGSWHQLVGWTTGAECKSSPGKWGTIYLQRDYQFYAGVKYLVRIYSGRNNTTGANAEMFLNQSGCPAPGCTSPGSSYTISWLSEGIREYVFTPNANYSALTIAVTGADPGGWPQGEWCILNFELICNPCKLFPLATISGDLTLCHGGYTTLTASQGNTYSWSTGSTQQSIGVYSADYYTVTIGHNYGCSRVVVVYVSVADTQPDTPVPTVSPSFSMLCSTVQLTADPLAPSQGWSNGQWGSYIYPYSPGEYTVTNRYTDGCTATSAAVYVAPCDGQPPVEYLTVYPNVADEEVNLDLPKAEDQESSIVIRSADGQPVYRDYGSGETKTFDTSQLKEGLYIISVQTGNEVKTKKIMVSHRK